MSTSLRMWSMALLCVLLVTLVSGCQRTVQVTATPLPTRTLTPTPFSTALPTVEPQATYGGDARPYGLVFMPPADRNPSGTALQTYLNDNSGFIFTVSQAKNSADALAALCGDEPLLAFVDGWTLLAAQAQGCGTPLLRYQRGRGSATSTGISADLIAPIEAVFTTLDGFKGQAFCRLNESDTQTWVLPVLAMRATQGFDPLVDIPDFRDLPAYEAIVSEVSGGRCVGAIPAGTLADYTIPNRGNATQTVRVIATIPELPYGGLLASSQLPPTVAERVARLLRDNAAELRGIIEADALLPVEADTYADIQRLLSRARFDFARFR